MENTILRVSLCVETVLDAEFTNLRAPGFAVFGSSPTSDLSSPTPECGREQPDGSHIYPFLDPEFDGKHDFGGLNACRDRYDVENRDLPRHRFIDFASYSISVGKLT